MTNLDHNQLMIIIMDAAPAEHGGCLDEVEMLLRKSGHEKPANDLLKLPQDAGLEMYPSFDPADLSNATGPESAKLYQAYEPVTVERVNRVLSQAHAILPEG